MGADQQFCLRWNNFHTNITSAFESLRDDEDFVDITLACEGRQIKAHKMVLSACSPYFRSLLRGNPCQHPIVFLKDVSFANLTSILDFMYHGEVNVSHNELATFLKTAEALRVRGLAEDEKKREGDMCTESSSPPPPRDPPEPCSPGRPDDPPGEGGGGVRVSSVGDNSGGGGAEISTPTSISEGPPTKRQRRRSGANVTTSITPSSEHDLTNTDPDPLLQQSDTVSRENVKNEPEDYVNEDDDMLGQQQQHQQQQQQHQQIANEDIKLDGFAGSNADDQSEYLSGEGSMSSRSQAAMQQLQDTFSTFIPGMAGQSPGPGFLQPPGSADHGRPHPPFSLEGVQGLPPGISALPGPSMSQAGGASQDASGQGRGEEEEEDEGGGGAVDTGAVGLAGSGPPAGTATVVVTPGGATSGGTASSDNSLSSPPLSSSSSANTFGCRWCTKVCSSRYNLRKHERDMHVNRGKKYACNICNREYSSLNSLQVHRSNSHPTGVVRKRHQQQQQLLQQQQQQRAIKAELPTPDYGDSPSLQRTTIKMEFPLQGYGGSPQDPHQQQHGAALAPLSPTKVTGSIYQHHLHHQQLHQSQHQQQQLPPTTHHQQPPHHHHHHHHLLSLQSTTPETIHSPLPAHSSATTAPSSHSSSHSPHLPPHTLHSTHPPSLASHSSSQSSPHLQQQQQHQTCSTPQPSSGVGLTLPSFSSVTSPHYSKAGATRTVTPVALYPTHITSPKSHALPHITSPKSHHSSPYMTSPKATLHTPTPHMSRLFPSQQSHIQVPSPHLQSTLPHLQTAHSSLLSPQLTHFPYLQEVQHFDRFSSKQEFSSSDSQQPHQQQQDPPPPSSQQPHEQQQQQGSLSDAFPSSAIT